ncbi:TrkH family potassium uptake protein [Carboxylicivirga sediminis]|uniref:TrkH family potassium uptake protein n=1 Tax=Carboxylicivirga sediminis TaxID=2006564 RepID=A0A941EZ89_9BACT|nr:TrkH family potassium uptake protein [Carboxylicivirga sediminis]MBR8534251.1 TrkH family potassium uptake protein [Carboxylicivirga sediminis]
MLNYRFIGKVLGHILLALSVFMFVCALVAYLCEEDDVQAHLISAVTCLIIGGISSWVWRSKTVDVGRREGFVIVTFVWIIMSLFGSLPYILSGTIPGFTNAFFETISGFTTTGASVVTDIEALPHGILLWRSITHLIGGMGIVVLAVAILPYFGFGGMSLYNAEAAGITNDKLHPRVKHTAKLLWRIYVVLILLETGFLVLGGMPVFDAFCHSFATIASGGFSTKNDSIAGYSPYIQYVIIVFMLFAGTNFTLFYFVWKGKLKKVFENQEFRVYLTVIAIVTAIVTVTLVFLDHHNGEESLRKALFQVVSLVTSTGFATADYTAWHPYLTYLMFLLLFSGACAGSTSGGIKIMRHSILFRNTLLEFKRMVHPHAVIPLRIQEKTIAAETVYKVLAFVMLYMTIFSIGTFALTFFGMDMDSAMGAAATTMGGIGPGIGTVGPVNNFFAVPQAAKWVLSLLMLLGRLELFTVLILFSPGFWKNN